MQDPQSTRREMKGMRRFWFALAALLIPVVIAFASPALGAIVRVKWDSANNGPGNDWDHAYHTVTAGLAAAASSDEVWVAGDAAHPYLERITLKAGVGLYGGFAGTETSRDQRDWQTNITVLDGNAGGSVVTSPSGATTSTVIDGFTVRNGMVSAYYGKCGGIYCTSSSPTISNNIITGNIAYGTEAIAGGVYCENNSAPVITSNTITANWSGLTASAWGIYSSSSPSISGNTICSNRNGGIRIAGSSTTISNNTISENSGPAICVYGSPTITSNTISANYSGIACYSGSPMISCNTISASIDGGIYCDAACSAIIVSNIITANVRRYDAGGGIYCGGPSQITNNTITANVSSYGGGIACAASASPAISNNIIAFNSSGIEKSSGSGVPGPQEQLCL